MLPKQWGQCWKLVPDTSEQDRGGAGTPDGAPFEAASLKVNGRSVVVLRRRDTPAEQRPFYAPLGLAVALLAIVNRRSSQRRPFEILPLAASWALTAEIAGYQQCADFTVKRGP